MSTTRSGKRYSVRFSTLGPWKCTGDGCIGEECRCQHCPICDRLTSYELLHRSSYKGHNGVWFGPHCIACHMEYWIQVYKNYAGYL